VIVALVLAAHAKCINYTLMVGSEVTFIYRIFYEGSFISKSMMSPLARVERTESFLSKRLMNPLAREASTDYILVKRRMGLLARAPCAAFN